MTTMPWMASRATRERAGPEEFLKGYRGYLQADAYGGYDAFFKDPARGLIEAGVLGALSEE